MWAYFNAVIFSDRGKYIGLLRSWKYELLKYAVDNGIINLAYMKLYYLHLGISLSFCR